MPMNPIMAAEEQRLLDAIADRRRALVEEMSDAYARGTLQMRQEAQGGPWAPLSAEAKARIIEEMARRYPPPGSPSKLDAVLAHNPRFRDVLARTLALSKSQYARIGPHLKEGKKTVSLDSPAVSVVDHRGRGAGPSTDFDCQSGRVCSMSFPDGMAVKDRPICLTLVAATFDPAMLDQVRWRVGKPVKILADGEAEPE
jgi:hypothetical protein